MGREIVYCHTCGLRILEDDLRKGKALTLLDKVFCAQCKAAAFSQMRPDGGEAPPDEEPPAEEAYEEAPDEPAYGAPRSRPRVAGGGRPAPAYRRPSSKAPLVIGAAVGFIAVAVLLILLISRSKPGGGGGTSGGTSGGTTGGTSGPVDNFEQEAARAASELESFVATKPGPDAILARCAEVLPKVRGTRHESTVEGIRAKAEKDRASASKSREFEEVLGRARTAAKEDAGRYERYREVVELFDRAYEIAVRELPDRALEAKEERDQYQQPYEREAQTLADEIGPFADRLGRVEKRYKDAVKVIDARFPERLKQSRAWAQLKAQRDQYAQLAGMGAASSTDPTDWKGFLRRADRALGSRQLAEAREDYLKAFRLMPPLASMNADERRAAIWAKYNVACIYFLEAKRTTGDAQKRANDTGFEWLRRTLDDGLATVACNCHGRPGDHLEKDEDLDAVRSDPRMAEILRKLGK